MHTALRYIGKLYYVLRTHYTLIASRNGSDGDASRNLCPVVFFTFSGGFASIHQGQLPQLFSLSSILYLKRSYTNVHTHTLSPLFPNLLLLLLLFIISSFSSLFLRLHVNVDDDDFYSVYFFSLSLSSNSSFLFLPHFCGRAPTAATLPFER